MQHKIGKINCSSAYASQNELERKIERRLVGRRRLRVWTSDDGFFRRTISVAAKEERKLNGELQTSGKERVLGFFMLMHYTCTFSYVGFVTFAGVDSSFDHKLLGDNFAQGLLLIKIA